MTGAERIAQERAKHHQLGYTREHDLEHGNGELVAAAVCYLITAYPALDPDGSLFQSLWPGWTDVVPHPNDPQEQLLEIAGSLVAADLDRLELDVPRQHAS